MPQALEAWEIEGIENVIQWTFQIFFSAFFFPFSNVDLLIKNQKYSFCKIKMVESTVQKENVMKNPVQSKNPKHFLIFLFILSIWILH